MAKPKTQIEITTEQEMEVQGDASFSATAQWVDDDNNLQSLELTATDEGAARKRVLDALGERLGRDNYEVKEETAIALDKSPLDGPDGLG